MTSFEVLDTQRIYNYRPAPIILYVHIYLNPRVMSVPNDTDVCTDFRS